MTVVPYALLSDDPLTEARIAWIDDTGGGGSEQSVTVDGDRSDSTATEIGDSGAYVYDALVTGLDPETEYSVTINSSETVERDYRTLPSDPDELRILITSDHHPFRYGSGRPDMDPEQIEDMSNVGADLLLYQGDWLTNTQSVNSTDTENWLEYWSWWTVWDRLVPIFTCPGNHDVGNSSGTAPFGDSPTDPENGYFQLFFPNMAEIEPQGENYGQVTIGDYLQVVSVDTHSASIPDQLEWLDDNFDGSVDLCIPIQHVAALPFTNRPSTEEYVTKYYLDELTYRYYEQDNIHVYGVGNEHARKITYPIAFSEEEPDSDYYELESGRYAFVDEDDDNAVSEVGEGYVARDDAGPADGYELWHLKDSDAGEDNPRAIFWSYLDVTWGSDLESIEQTDIDMNNDKITYLPIQHFPNAPSLKAVLHDATITDAKF